MRLQNQCVYRLWTWISVLLVGVGILNGWTVRSARAGSIGEILARGTEKDRAEMKREERKSMKTTMTAIHTIAAQFDACTKDRFIDVQSVPGEVRLAPSVLITNEMGVNAKI